jgi:hypothetical protein
MNKKVANTSKPFCSAGWGQKNDAIKNFIKNFAHRINLKLYLCNIILISLFIFKNS